MINDSTANIENSNQSVKIQIQNQTDSKHKPCRKSSKSKKFYVKSVVYADESFQLAQSSIRRVVNSSEHQTTGKTITPKKVKSASWKRSEKSTAPFNALMNKKHKTLRKKSPSWLSFTNSKIKKNDLDQSCKNGESLSVCRPGTTYSDVLFGAGCSNLAKMKNCITPRFYNNQSTNASQKKRTKPLLKFDGIPDKKTSQECETKQKKNIFPALQTIKNKLFSSSLNRDSNLNKNFEKVQGVEIKTVNTADTVCPVENDEGDVVILHDLKALTLDENNMSYGNYLEQHFQSVNDNVPPMAATSRNDSKYLVSSIRNIPNWNFMNIETGTTDDFPKFLCQFEDENYLKAENMALLGLKLALGSCTPKTK